MALEVKVFREITAYQPKVLFGLSWRQLAVAAVALPVVVGVYFLARRLGSEDVGVIAVSVLTAPAVAVGWIRPMGVAFERYVGFWWAYRQNRSPLIYHEMADVDHEASTKKSAVSRSAKRIVRFEREA